MQRLSISWGFGRGRPGRGGPWPVHRHVVHLDAAFGEQFLDVRSDSPNRRYQRTASVMTSGGKRNPANAEPGAVTRHADLTTSSVLDCGRSSSGFNATVRLDALWLAHFGSLGKTKVAGKVASARQARRSETSLGGRVGRWFDHGLLVSAGLPPDAFAVSPRSPMVSPTAPRQTVHAVLPHTAYRHRSPAGIHRRVAHRAFESVDPEIPQPVPGVAVQPVEPRAVVFPATRRRG